MPAAKIQNEPTGAVLDDRHRPCDSNLLAPDAPHHDLVSGLPLVFDCHRCTLPECDSALFFSILAVFSQPQGEIKNPLLTL